MPNAFASIWTMPQVGEHLFKIVVIFNLNPKSSRVEQYYKTNDVPRVRSRGTMLVLKHCSTRSNAWNFTSFSGFTCHGIFQVFFLHHFFNFCIVKVGYGQFTCCQRFDNHQGEDRETGQAITIPCDKAALGEVMSAFIQLAIDCYEEIGDLNMYRIARSHWQRVCVGLENVQGKFTYQPDTWESFCEVFKLNADLGMHLSNKQLKKSQFAPPLFYAVTSVNVAITKMILDSKVNPNFKWFQDGTMSLHWAADYSETPECTEILQMLVKAKANPYRRADSGYCSIAVAVSHGNDFFLKWMMNNFSGFHFDRRISKNNQSLTEWAISNGNLSVLTTAFSKGANFNRRNIWGSQPLNGLLFSPVDHIQV